MEVIPKTKAFDLASWKSDVLMAMLEKKSLQDILDIIARKILNPFSVLDNNSFIIGRSAGFDDIPAGTIWDMLKGNSLNIFDFYSTEEWKKLSANFTVAGSKPVLYTAERDPNHTYCSIALFNEGKRIGSIGTMDSHAPLDQEQLELLCVVRDMLEVYLRNEMISSASDELASIALSSIINGNSVPSAITDELLSLGWDDNDEFEVTAFDFSDIVRSDTEMASCLSLVKMQFPNAMVAPFIDQVIVCTDLTRQNRCSSLTSFMEQYDLYGGVSYPFVGFDNCSTYWKQASYAASISGKNKDIRIKEYRDVQFKHMKEVILKDNACDVLLIPSLASLANSSKKSDRILITCLKAYLLNGRSLSRTSLSLKVHRNTLIYRIRRLEEILQLNFDLLTDDQMAAMILSCCLVDSDTN